VERPLVDSRSLLFEPVRGPSRAGATRTPNIAGTQLPISQQSPGLNETERRNQRRRFECASAGTHRL